MEMCDSPVCYRRFYAVLLMELWRKDPHSFVALWRDERGMVVSTEVVLLVTITVLGLLVGLSVYRDAIVQEVGDIAASVAGLSQGYAIDATVESGAFGAVSYAASTDGSSYVDQTDFGETDPVDPPNGGPLCITIDTTTVMQE